MATQSLSPQGAVAALQLRMLAGGPDFQQNRNLEGPRSGTSPGPTRSEGTCNYGTDSQEIFTAAIATTFL